jgi:hypothetical protein
MSLAVVETSEITIRPIVTRDLFTVVRVIVPKLDMVHIQQLLNNMPKNENEGNEYFQRAGMEILMMVLNVAVDDEIQEWLADLVGMTAEQFLDSPIDTPFKIATAMWKNEDINKLFRTLLQ